MAQRVEDLVLPLLKLRLLPGPGTSMCQRKKKKKRYSVFLSSFSSLKKDWPGLRVHWTDVIFFLAFIQQAFMPDSECHVLCRYWVYKDEVTDWKEKTV